MINTPSNNHKSDRYKYNKSTNIIAMKHKKQTKSINWEHTFLNHFLNSERENNQPKQQITNYVQKIPDKANQVNFSPIMSSTSSFKTVTKNSAVNHWIKVKMPEKVTKKESNSCDTSRLIISRHNIYIKNPGITASSSRSRTPVSNQSTPNKQINIRKRNIFFNTNQLNAVESKSFNSGSPNIPTFKRNSRTEIKKIQVNNALNIMNKKKANCILDSNRNCLTTRNQKHIDFLKQNKNASMSVERRKSRNTKDINKCCSLVKPVTTIKDSVDTVNTTRTQGINTDYFEDFKNTYNLDRSNLSNIHTNFIKKWNSRNKASTINKARQTFRSPQKKQIQSKPEFKSPEPWAAKNQSKNKNKINISFNQKNITESTSRNPKSLPLNKPHLQQSASTICSISNKSIPPISKKISNIFSICHVGFSGWGIDKKNQDNYFINKFEDLSLTYVGVCDGHGSKGHLVSEFVSEMLPNYLYKLLKESTLWLNTNIIYKCWEDSFIAINSKLANNVNINSNFSGSTCVSLLISNEIIYSANVGDSRAIKGQYHNYSNKWSYEQLSRDHKPSDSNESKRIVRFGGCVEPFMERNGEFVGPKRVWLKNENIPGLAMTRSFGDQIASTVGVICEPELLNFPLKEEDKFIVLASDGLFEYISNQEVLHTVIDEFYMKDEKDGKKVVDILYQKAKKCGGKMIALSMI